MNIQVHASKHMHTLDVYYHKVSSKNTVFAIHKAVKSLDNALRFSLGFFAPVAFEFVLLIQSARLSPFHHSPTQTLITNNSI